MQGFTGKRVFKFQPPNNKAHNQAFFDKISSNLAQILVRGVGPPPDFTGKNTIENARAAEHAKSNAQLVPFK
jgi:hypothetical protein